MDPLQPFREEVDRCLKQALRRVGAPLDLPVETPDTSIADFAFPCFTLAKTLKKAPVVIAEELSLNLPKSALIEKAWAEKGYLNFRLESLALARITLETILREKEAYGRGEPKHIKVLLEHTSVNPTGPIHVGRARNPFIGDTLARCLRKTGYEVTTEYLVNDVGKQVVLLCWGVRNAVSDQEKPERDKDDHILVGYYRQANKLMETDPRVQEEIAAMTRAFEAGDPATISMVRETAERMLSGIKQSLALVGVHIDNYTWESQFIINGEARRVVERLKATPYCHEEGGALYLDLSEFGIHGKSTKFFFTRSDGTTLYTTRDMAYHLDKFKRADVVINVLGEDQKLGQQQLAAALKILGEKRVPECLFYAFVSLPEGRMSTRKGLVVYLDDLIDEAEERAYEEVRKRRTDLSEQRMREIARWIGRGALRFNMVRVQPEKQIVFKWEEALNFEGNSAPFVQYAHARCCSIMKKAEDYQPVLEPSRLTQPYEIKLIRILAQYPSVVRDCALKRRVHLLPAYAQEVAAAFNQFYAYVPVLRSGENQAARLTLVEATMWVLRSALDTLGIAAPEEM
ncbi:MAG: arginine--tRNA ligase [Methanomassiliicoccales archaeon]